MAILTLLESISPGTTLLSISLLSFFALVIYRAYLHPLAPIPGPFHCSLTSLWSYYHSYLGDECTQITALHRLYGPVLRIGPNEICIADGAALAPIYSEKGGFLKADNYRSFDFEGHATIFSAIEREHRAKRAKAVVGMFSMGAVRAGNGVIEGCVDRFVGRLKEEAEHSRRAGREGGKVNVLNLTRSLALDAISAYLFGKRFGVVDERGEKMSASGYVDLVVALGRFFFLPTTVFRAIEKVLAWFGPVDKEALESAEKVDGFVEGLIEREGDGEKAETYQGRLLKAGISRQETRIQCDDVIFAGTDSTGMNMSMLCWYLAKHTDVQVYARLREEITESDAQDPNRNPQALPYLDAVIREGLRLSMANPTRLPRTVPASGFTFTCPTTNKSYYFPPGTQIGCQIHTLHLNAAVFPEPHAFNPSRWLKDVTPEMQRDWIPFGLGARRCIARNLATQELFLMVRGLVREDVLRGAKAVGDEVRILEWFNSKVVGERVEVEW